MEKERKRHMYNTAHLDIQWGSNGRCIKYKPTLIAILILHCSKCTERVEESVISSSLILFGFLDNLPEAEEQKEGASFNPRFILLFSLREVSPFSGLKEGLKQWSSQMVK
ncbi:hypothetical protein V2J09_016036 [Rumex salicifolius]